MALRVVVGLVVLGALAVTLAWGWRALVVYAFFAGISGAVAVGTALGGGWLRDTSRGRFDRRED